MQIKKGYKQTEIGVIPEDWEVRKLGDQISKMIGGGTPSRNKVEYWNGNVFWATVKDISSFNPNYTKETITKEGLTNSASTLIKKGTVIIAARMALGKAVIYNVDVSINQDLKALFTKSCLIPKFLFYWFERNLQSIESLGNGSTVKGISTADLKSLYFPKVSLAEQQAIAAALSDVDAVISSLDQLITKKRNIKQGAMQELLTGKKRLVGFDKSGGKFKQTEIGMIPEDWEIVDFGWIIDYIKGFAFRSKDYQNDGTRIIRVSDTTFDSIKKENCIYIDSKKAHLYNNWKLKENDLVFSTVGSKPPLYDSMVGKVIIVKKEFEGCLLNQNAVLIRSKDKNKYNQYLIYNNFRTQRYLNHIEIIYRGNANQASITLEDLFKFKIALSPLPEQQAIAAILSDMDAEIEKLEQQRDKYKAIKQGMMQELLTGKTRLI